MPATQVGVANEPGVLNGRFRLGVLLSGTAERFAVAATDLSDGARVVVKFERPGKTPSLAREYAHLRRIVHPNIARVIDLGQVPAHADVRLSAAALWPESPGGLIYLVTADVGGESLALAPLLGSTPHEQADHLIRVAVGLADALAYMHGRNLIHGDVTPHNVALAPNGDAVLLDFGLTGPASWVGSGQGTPGFAAPEAIVGQVTPRSDLFGLGATLYFAWTGVAPFGIGRQGVLRMLERTPPPAPCTLKEGLPAWLDQIVLELLHPTPSRRPASALLVSRRLRKWSSANDEQALLSSLTSDASGATGDPLAGVFVGRTSELSTVADRLIQLVNGDNVTAALVLTGLPGSGRRALWSQGLSDFQMRAVAMNSKALDVVPAASVFESSVPPVISDPAQAALGRRAQFLSAVATRSERGPVCILLQEGAAGAPQTQDEWTSWWPLLAEVASPNCMFVVFAGAGVQAPLSAAPTFVQVALTAFAAADIAALCLGAGLVANPKSTEMIVFLPVSSCALAQAGAIRTIP